ncbi:VgrG-related protein [Micromonospora polyrhachis]|uniref:Phage protein D/phage baseplate assembly protein gpV n=1 Tax=Micromonospora polyrhachis TaxID=1282883 RepID=A0A7W7SWU6_9ACTN|nr:VgrG-related protein [Micromonospora polyrhachis]MBB4962443.1 phage protein D/phage baseplate assembly protein gpV [Micromonospora polyrhachis]
MANEQFANSLLIEVGGNPLPADVASLLVYAYVDDSSNLPDRFLLRYRDPGRTVLSKAGFKIGAEVKLRVQTSDPGGPEPLLTGEVTGLDCELDKTGTFTEVRGLDLAHRLFRGRRVAAYPNMTVPDVVRKVVQRAGLKAGQIDPVKGFGGSPDSQLSQDNVSDWTFLTRLAELVGAQVMMLDGALHFRLPEPPTGAPDPSTKATQDPLVLEVNRNLVSLRAGITATAQVPEVTVRGWDPAAKQAVSAAAKPKAAGTEVPGVDPEKLGKTFNSPPYLVTDPTLANDAAVRAVADATAGRLGTGFAEIEGVAKGNPKLRAGTAVALANVGEPFQGKYILTSTRHLFSQQAGYTTAFTVSGRSDRSLYGLTGGGPAAGRLATGVLPAIVSDVKDPQKLGRVRLTMPWLDGQYTTGWARLVQPGAGAKRGLVTVPEVGDEVLVGFTDGNLDAAYVLGGLHNGKDALPQLGAEPVDGSSGEVVVRALVSRTGHRLELTETSSGADGVLLTTGDNKFSLRLDKKGQLVEIISEGKVKVTAKNGMTVDSGTGPLELSGQKVTVKSKSDVGIEGTGQVSVKGTAGASVEGATVKVAGQGSTELTASGSVTVRGGIVKIN